MGAPDRIGTGRLDLSMERYLGRIAQFSWICYMWASLRRILRAQLRSLMCKALACSCLSKDGDHISLFWLTKHVAAPELSKRHNDKLQQADSYSLDEVKGVAVCMSW